MKINDRAITELIIKMRHITVILIFQELYTGGLFLLMLYYYYNSWTKR